MLEFPRRRPHHYETCKEMYRSSDLPIERAPTRLDILRDYVVLEALALEAKLKADDPGNRIYVGVRTIREVRNGEYTGILGYSVIQRDTNIPDSQRKTISYDYYPNVTPKYSFSTI